MFLHAELNKIFHCFDEYGVFSVEIYRFTWMISASAGPNVIHYTSSSLSNGDPCRLFGFFIRVWKWCQIQRNISSTWIIRATLLKKERILATTQLRVRITFSPVMVGCAWNIGMAMRRSCHSMAPGGSTLYFDCVWHLIACYWSNRLIDSLVTVTHCQTIDKAVRPSLTR